MEDKCGQVLDFMSKVIQDAHAGPQETSGCYIHTTCHPTDLLKKKNPRLTMTMSLW